MKVKNVELQVSKTYCSVTAYIVFLGKGPGKVHSTTEHEGPDGVDVSPYYFFNLRAI